MPERAETADQAAAPASTVSAAHFIQVLFTYFHPLRVNYPTKRRNYTPPRRRAENKNLFFSYPFATDCGILIFYNGL